MTRETENQRDHPCLARPETVNQRDILAQLDQKHNKQFFVHMQQTDQLREETKNRDSKNLVRPRPKTRKWLLMNSGL
jgi:hypothetical protein